MTSDNNDVFDVSFDVNDNFDSNDSNDGFNVDSSINPSQVAHNDIVTTDSTNSHQESNFVQTNDVAVENTLVIEDKSVISNSVVDQSSNQAINASDTQANYETDYAVNLADDVVDNTVDDETNHLDKLENNDSSEDSNTTIIANFPIIDSINNGIAQNNKLSIDSNSVTEETTLDLSDELVTGDNFHIAQPSNVTPIPVVNNIASVPNTKANDLPESNPASSSPISLSPVFSPITSSPVSSSPINSNPISSSPITNPMTNSNFDVNKPSISSEVVNKQADKLPNNVDKDIAETVEIPDSIFDSAINSNPNDHTFNTYPGFTANNTTNGAYHNPLGTNNSIGNNPATDNNQNYNLSNNSNNNDQGINNGIENNDGSSNEGNNENGESVDDESDVIENALPLTTPQNTTTRIMGKTSSDGKLSKRVIGVAVLLVLGVLAVWGTQENTNKGSANNSVATIKPIQVEKSNLKNTLNSPSMGERPDQGRMLPPPEVVEPPPPVIIAPPPEPPPLGGGQPVIINNAEPPPRQYSFQMRRGNMVMQKWEQEQKNELASLQARSNKPSANNEQANNVKIPRGTVIPMMMIQPFRNDLPGVVKCQVMVDVKTAKGQVLIPAGSIASVPFSPFRNDKRVFNRVDTPTIISVTNSNSANAASPTNTDGVVNEANEIQLFGTAMDRKGFVGLEGKVRKTGDASVIKRVGRTMARALTFGAASSVGGVGGVVVSEGGNSAIDSTYFYTDRTGTFVELPLGTMFFFNVN